MAALADPLAAGRQIEYAKWPTTALAPPNARRHNRRRRLPSGGAPPPQQRPRSSPMGDATSALEASISQLSHGCAALSVAPACRVVRSPHIPNG